MIGQTAQEFTVNEILPNAEKMEHKDFSISRDLLKKAGELGLSSVEIPGSLRRTRNGQGNRCRHRRPHRAVCRLCDDLGRAHWHWPAAAGLLRHRRAEEEIFAASGGWRNRWRVCLVRGIFRFRCAELPRPGSAFLRRQTLHPQRRKDVDYQCRLRRPVHRFCQDRWREIYRVSGGEDFPGYIHRRRKSTSWAFADLPLVPSF